MATTTRKTICSLCDKPKFTYCCPGCSQQFCFEDLTKHRANIQQEFDHLQNDHDLFRQRINDLQTDPAQYSSIEQINRWEIDSIKKIKERAEQSRKKCLEYSTSFLRQLENKLTDLVEQMKTIQHENEFNEIDLNDLKTKLNQLEEELNQLKCIPMREYPTSFINSISFPVPFDKDIRWKQSAITIVERNGHGNRLNLLNGPTGIYVDDREQLIYIADCDNHRIVEWELHANRGRIIAARKEQGNRSGPLNQPTNVVIDRQTNDLIIADFGNRRVMRWSRQPSSSLQIIIDNIDCFGLALHDDGTLYVSDYEKHQVRRWKKGETQGTIVAGGNGGGDQLNQLNCPTYLFIDDNHNLYISDRKNDRMIKWAKNAKEGIVVAGGNGRGDGLTQLSAPQGIVVDRYGQIYVVDFQNDRVMRWREGEKEGRIVVGGNGQGCKTDQLNQPSGLSFDEHGNLYVADCWNHRIQRFDRDFQ